MLFRGLCKFGLTEWPETVLLQIAISMAYDFRQVSNISIGACLHYRLNTWLERIGQRRLQDEMRLI